MTDQGIGAGNGNLVIERVLMTDPHHRFVFEFDRPSGDRLEIGQHQIIRRQIQRSNIANELPDGQFLYGPPIANAAFVGVER